MSSVNPATLKINFSSIIKAYKTVQSEVKARVASLAGAGSSASPGDFILLQFRMAHVTQVGESISNLISQVNSMINNAVRNQKTQ